MHVHVCVCVSVCMCIRIAMLPGSDSVLGLGQHVSSSFTLVHLSSFSHVTVTPLKRLF